MGNQEKSSGTWSNLVRIPQAEPDPLEAVKAVEDYEAAAAAIEAVRIAREVALQGPRIDLPLNRQGEQ